MKDNNFAEKKAEEWFRKADNDIKAAQIIIKEEQPPTDTICFHCQQSAEKYLKGYFTKKAQEFLKSHDLDYLLKLCVDIDKRFSRYREAALILNKYGIEPRYPADIPVYYSIEESMKAIELAKELVQFVRVKAGIRCARTQ